MPDSASVAEKVTWTGLMFQPLALAPGADAAVTSGGVLSRLIVTVVVAEPPGPVAVPEITWPAPSLGTTIGAGHDVALVQVKLIVGFTRCQPAPFADGVTVA